MAADRPPPLNGIRVLDFGHILAGPFCARLLADLGAEIVKVETSTRRGRTGARRGGAGAGDPSGRTPLLAHINRNRRSIDLNLKTERGLDIARRLADVADVLVENFSAGVMDRLGLGYEDLAASNPRLVFASMSAYGHTGPHRGWTGMNVTLQACSGLMLATGEPDDSPIGISNSWNDYIGGLHTALAIVDALSKRRESGRGRFLDVAQFECSVAMIGSLVLASAVTGAPPQRLGNRSPSTAPQGCYRCAGDDQWCAISVQSDDQWRVLVSEIGASAPQLGGPRFATLAGRREHHDEIDGLIESWTRTLPPAEVARRLQQCGVPAAPMRRGSDISETREWQRILHPLTGADGPRGSIVGLPFAFRDGAPVGAVAAPRLGEHGAEVLRDWLGLDEAVIAEMSGEATV